MLRRLTPVEFARSLLRIVRGRPQTPPALADNEMLRTILHRRSVRRFSQQPIADDVFAAILEAGRVAPSTVNLQTWSFAAFDADGWRAAFGRTMPFRGSRAVIVMGDVHRVRSVLDAFPRSPLVEHTVSVMNASLAAMAMILAAEALGVSSVMLSETGRTGLLDAAYLRRALALPNGVIPLMTIVFGHARGAHPPMPPKLPLEQIAFHDGYRPPDAQVMADWLAQMIAGYKASHLGSSFDAQLRLYRAKIGEAERDLHELILGSSQCAQERTAVNPGAAGAALRPVGATGITDATDLAEDAV